MGSYSLKPLRPNPDREPPTFGVLDIESYKWIQFRILGFAFKVDGQKHYESFENMGEAIDYMFSDEFPFENIFGHFAGKFDFSFVLKEIFFDRDRFHIGVLIPRGSGLLSFDVSTFTVEDKIPKGKGEDDVLDKLPNGKLLIRKKTITFRDSSAMLPFSLASLTENFKVEHKKKDIDFETLVVLNDEHREYLEYDCWGLYEVIEKYFNWDLIRQAGPAFTVASQSLRVFRTFLKKEISSLTQDTDAFVRRSYFGGRTEIFKPFFQQNTDTGLLKSYDVNSLYPYIMSTLDFPGGLKYQTQFYKENELGFYDVEVEVPPMYVPPLGTRYEGMDNRLIFPIGRFRGIWSTMELNYAMECGVKILQVFEGRVFHNIGPIFKEYIDYLYDIRKKSGKDSVDNVLCKLLMNSTYGRFGLNLEREQLIFDDGRLGIKPHMDIALNAQQTQIIRLSKQTVNLDTSFTNVAIAAWVTSGARIHMHRLISQSPHDMYYMDTDSLKTTHVYPRNDADLGQLKEEYKMKYACFLLPKTYLEDTLSPIFKMFDDKGKERKDVKTSKKIVMKGFDKRKIAKFTPEDFTSCLEGDMRRLKAMNPEKFAPLRSAIKKNEFLYLIQESERQIRTRYNKRRIIKRPWAQVYDTEPLHLEDGKVLNLDPEILKKWKKPTSEELDQITEGVISQWQ